MTFLPLEKSAHECYSFADAASILFPTSVLKISKMVAIYQRTVPTQLIPQFWYWAN